MRRAAAVAIAAVALAVTAAQGTFAGQPRAVGEERVIGQSVHGREITATQIGDPAAERVALVVGVIHGDERAGLRIIDSLRAQEDAIQGLQLWVISSVNPDGMRSRTRKNAHGVDLNRNFPFRWRGGLPHSHGYYPGPRPSSEPETRAVMGFVEAIQPDVSIWYHQPWGAVLACRGRPQIAARYAKLVGMGTSCRGKGLRGTAITWEMHAIPGSTAFVVELPHGGITGGRAERHADAAVTIAGEV